MSGKGQPPTVDDTGEQLLQARLIDGTHRLLQRRVTHGTLFDAHYVMTRCRESGRSRQSDIPLTYYHDSHTLLPPRSHLRLPVHAHARRPPRSEVCEPG